MGAVAFIKSIIPAPGWSAKYKGKDGYTWTVPLVCWALLEDGEVEGLVPEGVNAIVARSGNFVEYIREEKDR